MSSSAENQPLVAVVTPVYNGGAGLAQCLESVRQQRYRNWVHILLDNVSTDSTGEIAAAFAARDSRFRVHTATRHVCMVSNWNRALGHVPPEAVYVKQLHADDRLFPSCLEVMVERAERHPEASVVVSRFTCLGQLWPLGAPAGEQVIPGRQAAREAILGTRNLLANPSVPMVRRSAVSGWPELFDPAEFPPGHPGSLPMCPADKEGYLNPLSRGDLLFVPEILIKVHRGFDGAEGFATRIGAYKPGHLEFALRHGDRFFDDAELKRAVRHLSWIYARSLAWRIAVGNTRDEAFVMFHKLALTDLIPKLKRAGHGGVARLLGMFGVGLHPLGGVG